MFKVSQNIEKYKADLFELIRIFDNGMTDIFIKSSNNEKECRIEIKINNESYIYSDNPIPLNIDELNFNRKYKKFIKNSLYIALKSYFKKDLPWGSLTGVRPARLIYNELNNGLTLEKAIDKVKHEYFISDNKISLLNEIIRNQIKVIKKDNSQCFYVHIPICPTRCIYCSFVSTDFKHSIEYINEYVEKLKDEIIYTIKKIKESNLKIDSIYIGGGTPSILSANQLEILLIPLIELNVDEFTVECGRADTITEEKLKVLSKYKVSRICINPQTFNDKTLKIIGRCHSQIDVINAYKLARKFNFDINMDLIAGLPGETLKDFCSSVDKCIELNPENITIHTLSIKNAGLLKRMENIKMTSCFDIENMLNYAYRKLHLHGYTAYYLYRQKNMIGLFENVGYSKIDKFCRFNIYSMEDLKNIISCGAGAISKIIYKDKIERIANVKQIKEYLLRFDEMCSRKDIFFI